MTTRKSKPVSLKLNLAVFKQSNQARLKLVTQLINYSACHTLTDRAKKGLLGYCYAILKPHYFLPIDEKNNISLNNKTDGYWDITPNGPDFYKFCIHLYSELNHRPADKREAKEMAKYDLLPSIYQLVY